MNAAARRPFALARSLQSHGGFAGGLGAKDLDHTRAWETPTPTPRPPKWTRWISPLPAALHASQGVGRSLSKLLVHLAERGVDGALARVVID